MTNQLQHHPSQQRRAVDLRIPAIEKYAYCLCLHVRPTTIFIAVFKLIRALLFASILLNTELSMSDQLAETGLPMDERHRSTQIALRILSRLVMASVSAVGIYAVISGRAALLMPLYAMLLVDFFFALPAFYNRELDASLADSLADFRDYSTGNNQYTRYSLMFFSTVAMVVKIYFLCVIWKCYRYLRLIELVSPIRLSGIYPHMHQNAPHPIVRVLGSSDSTDLGSGHNVAPPPYESIASNMKPPNYEEAIKSSAMIYPTTNTTSSHNQQQQQTVVFANPTTEQDISTQVICDDNLRPTADILISSGNNDTASTTSTIVARDISDPQTTLQGPGKNQDLQSSRDPTALTVISSANPNTTTYTSNGTGGGGAPVSSMVDPAVNVVIPKVENNNTSDTHDV